jgi:2-polyprenyl-3-methyl-5-hydroxy-6-metoxy-1,4-benzoquinol methylase
MSASADFAPVAVTLRRELEVYFGARGRDPADGGLRKTIATNSELVEQRGNPLRKMLSSAGITSLRGVRLLDLGCGFGGLSAYFAVHGALVSGVDANASRFKVGRAAAAEHGLPVVLSEGRMEALAAPARPFDVVVMNNTFCYLVDRAVRQRALAGIAEVLRPGGLLLLRELNGWHPFDQFTHLPLISVLRPEHASTLTGLLRQNRPTVRLVSPPALTRELRDAGYVDVRQLSDRDGAVVRLTRNVARYQHVIGRR